MAEGVDTDVRTPAVARMEEDSLGAVIQVDLQPVA